VPCYATQIDHVVVAGEWGGPRFDPAPRLPSPCSRCVRPVLVYCCLAIEGGMERAEPAGDANETSSQRRSVVEHVSIRPSPLTYLGKG